MVSCHSCAQRDLFTKLSPKSGDDRPGLMSWLLCYSVLNRRVGGDPGVLGVERESYIERDSVGGTSCWLLKTLGFDMLI